MNRFNIFYIIKKHYATFYKANIGDIDNRIIEKKYIFYYHLLPFLGLILVILAWVFEDITKNNVFEFNSFINIISSNNEFIISVITAVSIFAPLLFSTLILMIDMQNKFECQIDDINEINIQKSKMLEIKKIIIKEMFAHILYSIVLCIMMLLFSFLYLLVQINLLNLIICLIDIYIILLFFETLFMVIKRLFNIISL